MIAQRNRLRRGKWVGIAISVMAISVGHYEVNMHAVVLHEVFTRLYYLPIVFAALAGGTAAGLGTALLASLFYVPHVVVGWHAWPAVQVGRYGEIVVFVLMGIVSGQLSAHLRNERDRARVASEQREEAIDRFRNSLEERRQVDRLVTTGRLATGMAHELRNPLGAARGALDILERGTILPERREEFFAIARRAIDQASTLVKDLLEFAQPNSAAEAVVDMRHVVQQAWRLTNATLAARNVALEMVLPDAPVPASVDSSQMQRALVTLLLEAPVALETPRVDLAVYGDAEHVTVTIGLQHASEHTTRLDSLFEPFTDARVGHGLTLALAKRLVENQHGTLHMEQCSGGVRVVLSLRGACQSSQPPAAGAARLARSTADVVTRGSALAVHDSIA